MDLTNEQRKNRELLIGWYEEIMREGNIYEHIDRDYDDYSKYFESTKNTEPDVMCEKLIKLIGDTELGEVLYHYLEDYYTYKQYLLYFTLTEQYEVCIRVNKLVEFLFNHIGHIIDCCRGTDPDVKEGLTFLFRALVDNLNNEFIKEYGL
jgi:hypothetical protein